jgi:hypothetical protein
MLGCAKSAARSRYIPQALHQTPRARVRGGGEGDDLFKSQLIEAEGDRGARTLPREPLSPSGSRQAPADLDRGREWQLLVGVDQADEADERRLAGDLHGP